MIVNIIAHSLGCAVVLHALELLAKAGCRNVIHHVFLWQPAAPDHALSSDKDKPAPEDPDSAWYLPQAAEAAYKISVLHSFNDNILGPIPEGQRNQRQINADRPIEELVPALLLTRLDYSSVQSLITAGKLYDRNQTPWLWSHSGMKIPSEALMDHVYKRWIATKQGLGVFGPFELPDRGDA